MFSRMRCWEFEALGFWILSFGFLDVYGGLFICLVFNVFYFVLFGLRFSDCSGLGLGILSFEFLDL